MKITKTELTRILREEIAVVTDDTIEDTVMRVLSDEGGAAGLDPIAAALEDLEDEEISLPDEPVEDVVGKVAGVKRHVDGDYIDTSQLEGKSTRITKRQLAKIIKEEKAKLLKEAYEYDPVDEMYDALQDLTDAQLKLEEIATFLEKSDRQQDQKRVQPFFNLANQVKKIMHVVGSQADGAYKESNEVPVFKRDGLDSGDII